MAKIKQWGRIKLWETSCCGIPMYPAAHKSYSLIKALTEANLEDEPSDKLNMEKNQMPEEEKQEAEEPKEEPKAETPEEAEKSEEPEEKAEEEPEEPIANSVKVMTDILAKALTKAIDNAEGKRGLLSDEQTAEKVEETLKEKSIGELAVMSGLFKGMGSSVKEF